MTKEALQIALEALTDFDYDKRMKAIEAIKEALETKDEPVAWMSEDEHTVYTSKQVDGCFQHDHIPLYTTPQTKGCDECGNGGGYALYCLVCSEKFVGNKEWVGLTNNELVDLTIKNAGFPILLAQAIEAKLKEKNGY